MKLLATAFALLGPSRIGRAIGRIAGFARRRLAFAAVALATLPQAAFADLPSIQQPTNGTGSGSLYDTIQGYAADGAVLLGLLLVTGGFLVVGGSALGKFNEARKRGEWGEFITVIVVGVILVVALIWLANKASDIL